MIEAEGREFGDYRIEPHLRRRQSGGEFGEGHHPPPVSAARSAVHCVFGRLIASGAGRRSACGTVASCCRERWPRGVGARKVAVHAPT